MKFKKLLLVLIFTGLTLSQASAQNFHLGLEGGANLSNVMGKDLSNANVSKLGFVGGGFLCLDFSGSFAIRPEILYSQKGGAVSGSSMTTEFDYLEVPVLLKFSLGTPAVNPGILLGPAFSWNTLAEVRYSGSSAALTGLNSSDIGIVGGVELDIDKILISGRYELGITDISPKSGIQNGSFTFLVGYSFM